MVEHFRGGGGFKKEKHTIRLKIKAVHDDFDTIVVFEMEVESPSWTSSFSALGVSFTGTVLHIYCTVSIGLTAWPYLQPGLWIR